MKSWLPWFNPSHKYQAATRSLSLSELDGENQKKVKGWDKNHLMIEIEIKIKIKYKIKPKI